jgi:hypothetical protein
MFCEGDRFQTVVNMFTHEDAELKNKKDMIPAGTTFLITKVQFPHVEVLVEISASTAESGEGAPMSGWICGARPNDPRRKWEKGLPESEYRPMIKLVKEGNASKRKTCWRCLAFFCRGDNSFGGAGAVAF